MPLRATKPQKEDKRLKLFIFGEQGCGKTTAGIQFPKPYIIDCEQGTSQDKYVDLIRDNDGVRFQTSDYKEILEEVTCLLTEKHDYKTLVIDPFTVLYENMLFEAEKEVGSAMGRHYGEANKRVKRLVNLILRLDMNVVITCHAKVLYGDNLTKLGNTFDGYKKLPYIFDLVLELERRGKKRMAITRKTRIDGFIEDEAFEFSYDAVAERYGKDILEKDSVPEVLATEKEVERLKQLIDLLKITPETVNRWISKAKSSSLQEMNQEAVQKCIAMLEKKLQGDTDD